MRPVNVVPKFSTVEHVTGAPLLIQVRQLVGLMREFFTLQLTIHSKGSALARRGQMDQYNMFNNRLTILSMTS